MTKNDRRALWWEVFLVLAVTFGASGVRAILRLLDALAAPEALNEQEVALNQRQSLLPGLDLVFQLTSSAVLFAWGGLALFLLLRHLPPQAGDRTLGMPRVSWRMRASDWLHGAGLAAVIGIPGLLLYLGALHFGFSAQVVPSGLVDVWWRLPMLIANSWANGVAEEVIVVVWLMLRLRQLGAGWGTTIAASSLLRGSYHLYQGVSAGFGNIVMGVVFAVYFQRTGRVWPLIIAHGLIDSVAFVGYVVVGDSLGV